MIDLGTGNNNKIDFVIKDKQDFIDIVENIYRGAIKVKVLVVSKFLFEIIISLRIELFLNLVKIHVYKIYTLYNIVYEIYKLYNIYNIQLNN